MIQSTPTICRDFELAHPGKRTASHRHIASCPPMVASPEHRAVLYLLVLIRFSRYVFYLLPIGSPSGRLDPASGSFQLLVEYFTPLAGHPNSSTDNSTQTPVFLGPNKPNKNHLRQFGTVRTILWSVRDSIQKWVMGSTSAWPCQLFLVEPFIPFRPPDLILLRPCLCIPLLCAAG
jgi:hypothetical protein